VGLAQRRQASAPRAHCSILPPHYKKQKQKRTTQNTSPDKRLSNCGSPLRACVCSRVCVRAGGGSKRARGSRRGSGDSSSYGRSRTESPWRGAPTSWSTSRHRSTCSTGEASLSLTLPSWSSTMCSVGFTLPCPHPYHYELSFLRTILSSHALVLITLLISTLPCPCLHSLSALNVHWSSSRMHFSSRWHDIARLLHSSIATAPYRATLS
jgi:hypothetical protein